MSSAAGHSPKSPKPPEESSDEASKLKSPPKRPTLIKPPKRSAEAQPTSSDGEKAANPTDDKTIAKSPHAPSEAAKSVTATSSLKEEAVADAKQEPETTAHYQLPIAPPSEPRQYRAIGLVRGTYCPHEEGQFNQGNLVTADGVEIDSVLLGRVTSLVKNHLDLSIPHLWVVYPRTRRNESRDDRRSPREERKPEAESENSEDIDLHLQIVGVWEPETLGLPGETPKVQETPSEGDSEVPTEEATSPLAVSSDTESETTTAETDTPTPASVIEEPSSSTATPDTDSAAPPLPEVDENYFSIRGEVIQYSEEEELITMKILQGVKRSPSMPKSFKVMVRGTLEGRTTGYFWDLDVKREEKILVLSKGTLIGIVPPRKKKGKGKPVGKRRPTGGPKRTSSRPHPSGGDKFRRDSHSQKSAS